MISPAWLIGLDALSFAVLAVQVGRLRGAPAKKEEPQEGVAADGADRSAAGLRLLRKQPELLGVLALTWFFNFLYGPAEVALPLHVTDDLHAGAGLLGLYWALFGAGAVLGGLAAGALRRFPLWPVTLGIVAGWGLALVPFGLGASAPVTLACFTFGGLIYGPFTALSYTLFQERTPAAWLTTVLAARSAALLTAGPVGTALGGPLIALLGPRQVLAASGARPSYSPWWGPRSGPGGSGASGSLRPVDTAVHATSPRSAARKRIRAVRHGRTALIFSAARSAKGWGNGSPEPGGQAGPASGNQAGVMFSACGPFWPCVMSKVTA